MSRRLWILENIIPIDLQSLTRLSLNNRGHYRVSIAIDHTISKCCRAPITHLDSPTTDIGASHCVATLNTKCMWVRHHILGISNGPRTRSSHGDLGRREWRGVLAAAGQKLTWCDRVRRGVWVSEERVPVVWRLQGHRWGVWRAVSVGDGSVVLIGYSTCIFDFDREIFYRNRLHIIWIFSRFD